MHHAVRVWEALQKKHAADLQRWFTLESGVHGLTGLTEVRYRPEKPWPRGVLRSAGVQFLEGTLGNTVRFLSAYQSRGAPTVRSSAPSDVTDTALAWLRTAIDERLQQPPAEFARRWRTELRSPTAPYAPSSIDGKHEELSQ